MGARHTLCDLLDTESVIFMCLPGEQVPILGLYMGHLTDELNDAPAEADYITEFVSGGQSAIPIIHIRGKSRNKCKVLTLKTVNSKVVINKSFKGSIPTFIACQQAEVYVTAVSDTNKNGLKRFDLKNETLFQKVQIVYNRQRVLPGYKKKYIMDTKWDQGLNGKLANTFILVDTIPFN